MRPTDYCYIVRMTKHAQMISVSRGLFLAMATILWPFPTLSSLMCETECTVINHLWQHIEGQVTASECNCSTIYHDL